MIPRVMILGLLILAAPCARAFRSGSVTLPIHRGLISEGSIQNRGGRILPASPVFLPDSNNDEDAPNREFNMNEKMKDYADANDKIWRKQIEEAFEETFEDTDMNFVPEDTYAQDLTLLAIVPPALGFLTYGAIARAVAYVFENFSGFQNVDGNAFAAEILRPTINGIVVPATAIVLGTLFATTVNVLWNRQLQMRAIINKEAGELRLLRRALFGCFGTAQHSERRAAAITLLHNYTKNLQLETQPYCVPRLQEIQWNGGISQNEMDNLADMLHGVDGAAASRQSSVSTAESLLVSLNSHRSERVATTLSVFPKIHWLLLMFLYASLNTAFFIDSNQGVLQYLNSLQLRILFSIILGVGSGSAVLLRGLEDPFQGPFSIRLAAMQLQPFEELLESDLDEADKERRQVGIPALVSLRSDRPRPNYNTGNTIYFHLLTGPRGGSVKILGDLFAWVFRQFFRLWTGANSRRRRLWSWLRQRI